MKKQGDSRRAVDIKATPTNRVLAMRKLVELKLREKAMKDKKKVFIRDGSVITVYGDGIQPSLAELPMEIIRMKEELMVKSYTTTIPKKEEE